MSSGKPRVLPLVVQFEGQREDTESLFGEHRVQRPLGIPRVLAADPVFAVVQLRPERQSPVTYLSRDGTGAAFEHGSARSRLWQGVSAAVERRRRRQRQEVQRDESVVQHATAGRMLDRVPPDVGRRRYQPSRYPPRQCEADQFAGDAGFDLP